LRLRSEIETGRILGQINAVQAVPVVEEHHLPAPQVDDDACEPPVQLAEKLWPLFLIQMNQILRPVWIERMPPLPKIGNNGGINEVLTGENEADVPGLVPDWHPVGEGTGTRHPAGVQGKGGKRARSGPIE